MDEILKPINTDGATGNIYCDGWWDQGDYYREYTIDCGGCGVEAHLDKVGKYKRTKTAARELGWGYWPEREKWMCPECLFTMGVIIERK